jgi:hypothetical protein
VNVTANLERFAQSSAAPLEEVGGAEEAAVLRQQNPEFEFSIGRYLDMIRLLLHIHFLRQKSPNSMMMNRPACET